MTALRHLLSILLLPTTVAGVVPFLLATSARFGAAAWPHAPRALAAATTVLGIAFIGAGLSLVAVTIRRFATRGRGTLAPWDPPTRLVVAGVYRHVRNPMISGVVLLVLGEALALRAPAVLAWALVVFAINAVYIPLVEEPGLERRFGEPYRVYRRHVPRWVPRRTPWAQENEAV